MNTLKKLQKKKGELIKMKIKYTENVMREEIADLQTQYQNITSSLEQLRQEVNALKAKFKGDVKNGN